MVMVLPEADLFSCSFKGNTFVYLFGFFVLPKIPEQISGRMKEIFLFDVTKTLIFLTHRQNKSLAA